ncbi:MAG: pantoate--beta-alanine ligase [Flavobacteriales bacterium]|nr:pantoate--beta-alanine ligase [Flavobacteriales bacterium]
MRIFKNIADLKPVLSQKKEEGCTVGLVPTMGALHSGHLSLINRALAENNFAVITIFVNPTQFDNSLDFDKYPREIDADTSILSHFENKIGIYAPELQDIYPSGIASEHFDYGGIENEMEGKFRTGHFDGVGTILKTLFQHIKPNKAYFGEKDFQQLQIVKQLVILENLPIEIVGCPIYREPSGLAMSSRNKRLSKEQAEGAATLFKILSHVRNQFGIKNANDIKVWVENEMLKSAMLTLEYFEIAEENTLKPMRELENDKKYRAFIAAYAGEVRLIDNIPLN